MSSATVCIIMSHSIILLRGMGGEPLKFHAYWKSPVSSIPGGIRETHKTCGFGHLLTPLVRTAPFRIFPWSGQDWIFDFDPGEYRWDGIQKNSEYLMGPYNAGTYSALLQGFFPFNAYFLWKKGQLGPALEGLALNSGRWYKGHLTYPAFPGEWLIHFKIWSNDFERRWFF